MNNTDDRRRAVCRQAETYLRLFWNPHGFQALNYLVIPRADDLIGALERAARVSRMSAAEEGALIDELAEFVNENEAVPAVPADCSEIVRWERAHGRTIEEVAGLLRRFAA